MLILDPDVPLLIVEKYDCIDVSGERHIGALNAEEQDFTLGQEICRISNFRRGHRDARPNVDFMHLARLHPSQYGVEISHLGTSLPTRA